MWKQIRQQTRQLVGKSPQHRLPVGVQYTRLYASAPVDLPEKWLPKASKELKGKDPKQVLGWHTPEGIDIKPLYTQEDVDIKVRETDSFHQRHG